MKIGLIDVDGHNYPNLPLMKLSAWHKKQGDNVTWYIPTQHGFPLPPMDKVYMSKVFSFTPDYTYFVNANEIIKGGSGYCIKLVDGKEIYQKEYDTQLPYEVEHTYPDYELYEWKELLQQLIDSKAKININQGVDIRIMTDEKAEMIGKLRVDSVHFAWDRYEDKEIIIPKFKAFKEITGWGARKTSVYVLTNFNTTIEQDLERIYTLRDLDYDPYVMVYNKEHTKSNDPVRLLQRWVNNRKIFKTIKRFEDYDPKRG